MAWAQTSDDRTTDTGPARAEHAARRRSLVLRGRRGTPRSHERGIAMVEFAILLPLLAMIVMGVIELGRVYSTWNAVKNAAREGANYAQHFPYSQNDITPPSPDPCTAPNNITSRAQQEAGSKFNVVTTPATPDGSGCDAVDKFPAGQNVTVTVSTPFTLFTPLVQKLVGNLTISASVTVRVLG
jgi:Flp pilus assembly protein TadG